MSHRSHILGESISFPDYSELNAYNAQGFDWHGPSAMDAWSSLAALIRLLLSKDQWAEWTINSESRVIVIGHSNGGQGTWYLATRYPDRVFAGTSEMIIFLPNI